MLRAGGRGGVLERELGVRPAEGGGGDGVAAGSIDIRTWPVLPQVAA